MTPAELETVIAFARDIKDRKPREIRKGVQMQFITVCEALVQLADAKPEKVLKLTHAEEGRHERDRNDDED